MLAILRPSMAVSRRRLIVTPEVATMVLSAHCRLPETLQGRNENTYAQDTLRLGAQFGFGATIIESLCGICAAPVMQI